MPLSYCDVFAILWRSIHTMACFFDCFRPRDNRNRHRPHLVSNSTQLESREALGSENRLSSLFLAEEREDTIVKDHENLVRRSGRSDIEDRELKEEARFLKACGTIPETPVEIRKASKKLKDSPPPTKKLLQDYEHELDQPPNSSTYSKQLEIGAGSKEGSPTSCIINEEDELRISINSPETNYPANAVSDSINELSSAAISSISSGLCTDQNQSFKKSVRFNDQVMPSESSPEPFEESYEESHIGQSTTVKPSAYPTPLKLTDDMETPGTVFATNPESLAKGVKARIRSQYVCAVRENLVQNELNMSSWPNPPPLYEDVEPRLKANAQRTHGDRPILGLVATYWVEPEEQSKVSPKGWDGNGIPNSTTKYKEDQKVNWHATPFEERLEKALTEDSSFCQRKPIIESPIAFEEHEENESVVTSSLQSLNHSRSVVSF